MEETMELNQAVYSLLAAQITFGTYRFGDPLPRMEDAGRWFSVSLDTVRAAYLRLKREGWISLTKKAGAAVVAQLDDRQIEGNIQSFFSLRREAVMDLCRSLEPLFGRVQWFALKNIPPDRLNELERLCVRPGPPPPYMIFQHIRLIYGTLNNDLLLRLVWQATLFYQAPFLSLPQNQAAFSDGDGPLLDMIGLCRQKDWSGLRRAVDVYQKQLRSAIIRFYETSITEQSSGEPISFRWNAYQSATQRCYSLAMELLQSIHMGHYPQAGFLPSPAKIAEEKGVSVSTVRRTLALLNQLGATRSVNGVGTRTLSTGDSAENCDFSQPAIRKRLLDFAQSLQLLALTCGACAQDAFAAMDGAGLDWYRSRLAAIRKSGKYESVVFATLELIPRFSPIRAIREIYGQLLQILIWGYPLRGMHGSRKEINAYYLPYLDALADCLEQRDGSALAVVLEKLLGLELRFAAARLDELGISAASGLVLPDEHSG